MQAAQQELAACKESYAKFDRIEKCAKSKYHAIAYIQGNWHRENKTANATLSSLFKKFPEIVSSIFELSNFDPNDFGGEIAEKYAEYKKVNHPYGKIAQPTHVKKEKAVISDEELKLRVNVAQALMTRINELDKDMLKYTETSDSYKQLLAKFECLKSIKYFILNNNNELVSSILQQGQKLPAIANSGIAFFNKDLQLLMRLEAEAKKFEVNNVKTISLKLMSNE